VDRKTENAIFRETTIIWLHILVILYLCQFNYYNKFVYNSIISSLRNFYDHLCVCMEGHYSLPVFFLYFCFSNVTLEGRQTELSRTLPCVQK